MTDNTSAGPTLDLSQVNAEVMRQYGNDPAPAAEPAAPVAPAAEPAAPAAASPTTPDPAAAPVTPKAEWEEVEIEPGKKIKVAPEGKDYLLRHADYTRKTQETAKLRKELEDYQASIRTEAEEFKQFLNNPAAVAQFLKEMHQAQPDPSSAPSPSDFVDHQALQAQVTQIQQNMQNQLAQTAAALDNQRKVAEMKSGFDKVLDETIGKNSVLLTIHDRNEIEELIRKDVQALKPMTVEEARQAIVSRTEARAAKVTSHLEELRKQQAVELASKQKHIEPSGGNPPSPPQTNFKLSDKGLTEAAIRYIEANATRR